MPYVNVHIDVEDVIDDLDEDDLLKALSKVRKKKGRNHDEVNVKIPMIVANETCEEASRILRKIGRVDLAFKLDETRNDYLEKFS